MASLQYTYVNIDGFSEKGSLAALQIPSQSAESLRTDLGFRAFYLWQVGKVVVEPSLRAAVARTGSKSSRRGRRREMLRLRADLRLKPKRRLFELMKITRTPGQSAGDLPVRRRGRRAGVAVVSESGVRTLVGLVSRRDAAQGNGTNGQRVGERAEHDISEGATYRGG